MFARFLSAIIHDSLDVISKISVRLDKEHVNSRCSEYLGLECKISANSRSIQQQLHLLCYGLCKIFCVQSVINFDCSLLYTEERTSNLSYNLANRWTQRLALVRCVLWNQYQKCAAVISINEVISIEDFQTRVIARIGSIFTEI